MKLTEALRERHKNTIDSELEHSFSQGLTEEGMHKLDKALPNGHELFDFNPSYGIEDPDVAEHLAKHGWNIKHYPSGIAEKKILSGDESRGIPVQEKTIQKKIGKILDETDAPDHIKTTFTNDPNRTRKGNSKLKMLITTHPYGICGKSTGTSWTSCMNLDNGSNRNYLKDDMEHATHEAYLVHHDDATAHLGYPDQPIARLSLKRHDTEGSDDPEDEDTIWRPEHNNYGDYVPGMYHAALKWSKEKYPAMKGVEYIKHPSLYDDGEKSYSERSKEDLLHDIEHGINAQMTEHDSHEQESAMKLFRNENDETRKHKIAKSISHNISNLEPKHVNELISHVSDPYVGRFIAEKHPNGVSSSSIEKIVERSGLDRLPTSIIASKKFPDKLVDTLSTNNLEYVHPSKIKPHHVDKMVNSFLNSESGSYYPLTKIDPKKLTEGHIDRLLGSKKASIIHVISKSPNFSPKHMDEFANAVHLMGTGGTHIYQTIENHKHPISDKSFNTLIKYNNGFNALAKHKLLSDEQAGKIRDMILSPDDMAHKTIPNGVNPKIFSDHKHISSLADLDSTVRVVDPDIAKKLYDELDHRVRTETDPEKLEAAHDKLIDQSYQIRDDLGLNDEENDVEEKARGVWDHILANNHHHHWNNEVNVDYPREIREVD